MHHYIQDSSILTLSYPGSRYDQLWSKLEDIAIIIIILSPGCQQPLLVKMASDNRLSAATSYFFYSLGTLCAKNILLLQHMPIHIKQMFTLLIYYTFVHRRSKV